MTAPPGDERSWFDDEALLVKEVRTLTRTLQTGGAVPGYAIESVIHTGGQATVSLARDDRSGARVAIKVLGDSGYLHEVARARFAREAEIVRGLDHPHIVRVLASGTTPENRPYLVMQYVDAVPLDEWAARPQVNGRPEAYLPVFEQVCAALQYAHARGVIHRDLKPRNILVDRAGRAHVVDFGLAKATADARATLSAPGQFLGTLSWASPEQLACTPDAVDVRSDVYSLGVILFQLATGALPYEPRDSLPATLNAMLVEAPRRPRSVRPELDRDLEAIILGCLARTPDDRPQSVAALLDDIRSYRRGEPIRARRDQALRGFQRSVRRYRLAVAVTLLIGGALGLLAWSAARQRARAERAALDSRRAVDFVIDMISEVDPSRSGRDVTVAELLDDAGDRIAERFPDQPRIQARLHLMLGRAFADLGVWERATAHYRAAAARARSAPSPDDTLLIRALLGVASFSDADADERAALVREAVLLARRDLGAAHSLTLAAEESLLGLEVRPPAERLTARQTLCALAARSLEPASSQLRYMQITLFQELLAHGTLAEADAAAQRMQAEFNADPDPESQFRLAAGECLAGVRLARGEPEPAIALFERSMSVKERVLGPAHPATAGSRLNLAIALLDAGRNAAADEHLALLHSPGTQLPFRRTTNWLLLAATARAQAAAGDARAAIAGLTGHVAALQRPDGSFGHHAAVCLETLADLLIADGDFAAALDWAERIEADDARLGLADWRAARNALRIAECTARLGPPERAHAAARRATQRMEAVYGAGHGLTRRAAGLLAAAAR